MTARPKIFYQYRSLVGQGSEFARNVIEHTQLYLGPPTHFNDPFDCKPVFTLEVEKSRAMKGVTDAAKTVTPWLNRAERRRMARENWSSRLLVPENQKAFDAHLFERTTAHFAIMCVTEVNNDILMWSHYADSHRGICIGYDSKMLPTARPVIYQEDRPVLHLYEGNPDNVKWDLIKSPHWSYEKEWRVREMKGPGIYEYDRRVVKEVIIGCQISDQDRRNIESWVAKSPFPPKLFSAKPSNRVFEIEIHPL